MTIEHTALGNPIHRDVHDACPACDGQRCQVYATEDQANAAVDQDAVGAAIEAGVYDPS